MSLSCLVYMSARGFFPTKTSAATHNRYVHTGRHVFRCRVLSFQNEQLRSASTSRHAVLTCGKYLSLISVGRAPNFRPGDPGRQEKTCQHGTTTMVCAHRVLRLLTATAAQLERSSTRMALQVSHTTPLQCRFWVDPDLSLNP